VTRYDERPGDPGFPEGIVTTEYLKEVLERGKPLDRHDPKITAATIPLDPSLGVLLDALSKERAALVVEDEHQGTSMFRLFHGLITISDLNRQSFRSLLYTLLADLEAGLSRFIEARCPEPWDWLATLSEDHQVRLLGYWELAKRRSVDVGPVAAATLAQLLTAVGKLEVPRAELGYSSRNKFEDATGKIPRLRNDVMHPVRPLILGVQDVAQTRQTIDSVLTLCRKLDQGGFMEHPRTLDGHFAMDLATHMTKPTPPEPAKD
jgi:hypothetical protein